MNYCNRRNIRDGHCSYVCGQPRDGVDEAPLQCDGCAVADLKAKIRELEEENESLKRNRA